MRTRARISFPGNERTTEVISRFGLEMKVSGSGGVRALRLFEDDERYHPFIDELRKADAHPITFTEPVFTKKEMQDAEFFEVLPSAQWGYPQPCDDFGYLSVSFHMKSACPICGQGAAQVKPYHLIGPPKFGRNDISTLFWTYDLLITERLRQLIKDASLTGVEFWPLEEHRNKGDGGAIDGACQLYVTNELPLASPSTDFPVIRRLPKGRKACQCGRLGRNSPVQFHYKRKDLAGAEDFNKTHEWLGGGFDTSRSTIVRRSVYNLFMENKIKGVKFSAVAIED